MNKKVLLVAIPFAAIIPIYAKRRSFAMAPITPMEVKEVIQQVKNDYPMLKHVPTPLVLGIVETESDFDPKAIGSVGEIGLMQVKPSTSQWIRNLYGVPGYGVDVNDQILDGMLFLHWILEKTIGHIGTIHAYNVGYEGYITQNKRNWKYVANVLEGELRWLI